MSAARRWTWAACSATVGLWTVTAGAASGSNPEPAPAKAATALEAIPAATGRIVRPNGEALHLTFSTTTNQVAAWDATGFWERQAEYDRKRAEFLALEAAREQQRLQDEIRLAEALAREAEARAAAAQALAAQTPFLTVWGGHPRHRRQTDRCVRPSSDTPTPCAQEPRLPRRLGGVTWPR